MFEYLELTKYSNGQIHREERFANGGAKPSMIGYYPNGNIEEEYWKISGELSRKDQPAVVQYFENRSVYSRTWYKNGLIHRIDGPAVIKYNDDLTIYDEEWWVNSERIKKPFDNYPLTDDQLVEMKLTYE